MCIPWSGGHQAPLIRSADTHPSRPPSRMARIASRSVFGTAYHPLMTRSSRPASISRRTEATVCP